MAERNKFFQFEDLHGPLIDEFVKANKLLYDDGIVRVHPPGCAIFTRYKNHAENIRHFTVRSDDVWIVTYPKCGTTWTQEMVWLLMNNLDYDTARKLPLSKRSPFMEIGCFIDESHASELHKQDTLENLDKLESPRCIKSHLPMQMLPKELWTVKPKIVYVAREAKDVLVSYYHHHRTWNGYEDSIDKFAEVFIKGYVGYGSIWDHILEFWKIRNEPNILFNTFEEMKKNLPAVVERTSKFLNCSLNSEQIKQLCEHLSFESMKKNPAVNLEEELRNWKTSSVEGDKTEPFLRKGQVGGWKDDITPQLAEKINKWTGKKLKGTSYTVSV